MPPSRVDREYLSNDDFQIIDLPILRTEPSYDNLLEALKDLELPHTTWNGAPSQDSTIKAKVVSQYLLSIISSDLKWLDNADNENETVVDQREKLWELASRRLAERCGRSAVLANSSGFEAMPEMVRTWVIAASKTLPELHFEIREPPLTGDKLGLKTWGTAFAIVKKLEELGGKYFDHLLDLKSNKLNIMSSTSELSSVRVLELGSGTGLVGIAAAAIWKVDVILTDLPEIKENLLFNINRNIDTVQSLGGSIRGEVLDWKDPSDLSKYSSMEFEIVIAADSLYDDEHPELVAQNIKRYIKPHESSRVLVAIPMRDNHTKSMAERFKHLMREYGLELVHHGEEICHDDWAEDEGEDAVKCWWGIWRVICAP